MEMELNITRAMGCMNETLHGNFTVHESAQFCGDDIDKAQRVFQGLCSEINRLDDEDVGVFLDKLLAVIHCSQQNEEE